MTSTVDFRVIQDEQKKWSFLFFAAALSVSLFGCDGNSGYDYDYGYEAAWDEEKVPTRYSSQEYREGYEQGLEDAAMYDEGYYDGYNKKRPQYPKHLDYMDGYKDGKKYR